MAALDKLQELSLVSKICTELDSHLGLADKTLAEFIIHLAESHGDAKSFRTALDENGAEFPPTFCDKLFNLIKAMRPHRVGRKKTYSNGDGGEHEHVEPREARNAKEAAFPGLRCSLPPSLPPSLPLSLPHSLPRLFLPPLSHSPFLPPPPPLGAPPFSLYLFLPSHPHMGPSLSV
ncbi:atp-dependent rna helicase dhx8, partial [Nannochloropsis gaditana]